MEHRDWRTQEPAGLIILTDGQGGLWDRESLELVAALEGRMSCFVTFATQRSVAPSLSDAMNACRYMGCDGAVVVNVSSVAVGGSGPLPADVIAVERAGASPAAIESAYFQGCLVTQAVAV
jgi:hypothetical protein